jgi:hypothetical protein
MAREEAISIAQRFVESEGIEVGPIHFVYYFTGAESEYLSPPCWGVYFEPTKEQLTIPPKELSTTDLLCISVEEESGKTRRVWWL